MPDPATLDANGDDDVVSLREVVGSEAQLAECCITATKHRAGES